MIVVVADDFTGAAEMCGIGLRYNLNVEINTTVNLQTKADMLVIAADTRSMPRDKAMQEMGNITRQIVKLKPSLFFKKVDSVLRGHIATEIMAHLEQFNLKRTLLVPANPSFNRTIVNGEYLINNEPLHLSGFANDPEFPVNSSLVKDILKNSSLEVYVQTHNEELKNDGIIVGEVANVFDLKAWAAKPIYNTLLAGGADFFRALLDRRALPKRPSTTLTVFEMQPVLIVSGTAYAESSDKISQLKRQGAPVSYMPAAIANSICEVEDKLYDEWCAEIISCLKSNGKAIIAIDKPNVTVIDTAMLRKHMANVVARVFKQVQINELLIEGGSTAADIFRELNLTGFNPVAELAPGVIRMTTPAAPNLYITIKPGSYAWPDSVNRYTLY